MIKNIIFDMGGVLIDFNREYYLNRLGLSKEEQTTLLNQVFLSLEWIQMDRGSKTEQTAYESMIQRLPQHLHAAAHALLFDWEKPELLLIDGMGDLVRELKENGYHIFLISNASVRQPEYWPMVPCHDCFENTLVSALCGYVKPEPAIYHHAFEKFCIKPSESIFIDDVPLNVEASVHCGMDAIVFHNDIKELRQNLAQRGIKVSAN